MIVIIFLFILGNENGALVCDSVNFLARQFFLFFFSQPSHSNGNLRTASTATRVEKTRNTTERERECGVVLASEWKSSLQRKYDWNSSLLIISIPMLSLHHIEIINVKIYWTEMWFVLKDQPKKERKSFGKKRRNFLTRISLQWTVETVSLECWWRYEIIVNGTGIRNIFVSKISIRRVFVSLTNPCI